MAKRDWVGIFFTFGLAGCFAAATGYGAYSALGLLGITGLWALVPALVVAAVFGLFGAAMFGGMRLNAGD